MKCLFRVDASYQIGTGHVWRCLTLADALVNRGFTCIFACCEHEGNLNDFIEERGYRVYPFSVKHWATGNEPRGQYLNWVGSTLIDDADQVSEIVKQERANWVVVDHYGIDIFWHRRVKSTGCHIMVIDDLADRPYDCDLLLDQNLGEYQNRYDTLVSPHARLLIGPKYALLRAEFSECRSFSLERRQVPKVENILISMGGVDVENATGQVLEVLERSNLSPKTKLTVILGARSVWRDRVSAQLNDFRFEAECLVGVRDMARRMASADLAIGAAGSTSWERCALGLPTLMLAIAQNQVESGKALHDAGAAVYIGEAWTDSWRESLLSALDSLTEKQSTLSALGAQSALITDGCGTDRVCEVLLSSSSY